MSTFQISAEFLFSWWASIDYLEEFSPMNLHVFFDAICENRWFGAYSLKY